MTEPRRTPSNARRARVAVAAQDAAERPLAVAEVRAPAVVLEAGEHARAVDAGQLDLDRDVADQPRALLADGAQVDEADAGDLLVAELVGVAEELVAAADGEDRAAVGGRGVQRVALALDEVLRAELLVAVLAAAEVEEVVRGRVDVVAEARRRGPRSRSRATRTGARAAAGCRGRRRCS